MLAATVRGADHTRLALVNQRTDSREHQDGPGAKNGSKTEIMRSLANDSNANKDEPRAHDDSERLALLTPREREVYPLLAKANKEIASALGIAERTVRFHVENITRKLGRSRREILAKNWLERQ
jgi:DNA-binding NarL/FixJ family response regulator